MVSERRFGNLYIKKRTPIGWMMLVFFLLPFLMGALTELLGLPDFIRYLMDAILIALCVLIVLNRSLSVVSKVSPLLVIAGIFFVYTLVVYIFNYDSLFYYIWGVRNNFRFYIAFLAFVMFVCEDEAQRWLELLDVLFFVHAALVMLQFFVMNVGGDYLGGIFGIGGKNNGYTIMLMLIALAKSLIKNFAGEEKLLLCMTKCFLAIFVAALTEIKFFSFLFVMLLVIICLITRPSRQKLVVVTLGIVGMMIGSFLLVYLYEEFEDYLSLTNLIEYATKRNYASGRDLNRLSAIQTLAEDYIPEPHRQLFGLGMGNCDHSDVAIFDSVFYQQHSWLHYMWFSSAMLFLETGVVGLVIYMSFFVVTFFCSRGQLTKHGGNELFCRLAMVMSLMSIVIIFYNSSMRIESGYMAYFIMALPFLQRSKEKEITEGSATLTEVCDKDIYYVGIK